MVVQRHFGQSVCLEIYRLKYLLHGDSYFNAEVQAHTKPQRCGLPRFQVCSDQFGYILVSRICTTCLYQLFDAIEFHQGFLI